jgi:hypothetical protein
MYNPFAEALKKIKSKEAAPKPNAPGQPHVKEKR